MHILTEQEMTGAAAKRLREAAGMAQREFWEAVGVRQPVGCRYEAGRRIPRQIRILLFARFVAGLRLDASTADGAAELVRLAHLQASGSAVDRAKTGEALLAAKQHITEAVALLSSIH